MIYAVKNGEIYLNIRIKTNARKEGVVGILDNRLLVAINQPPIDGKANAALIEFLSDYFKIPKSSIVLIKGSKSKDKQLQLPGNFEEQIVQGISRAKIALAF